MEKYGFESVYDWIALGIFAPPALIGLALVTYNFGRFLRGEVRYLKARRARARDEAAAIRRSPIRDAKIRVRGERRGKDG